MNKPMTLRQLVAHARAESAPHVDVADKVLGILAAPRPLVSYRPLMWIASFSSAAAACLAVVSFLVARASTSNALSGMYEVISWAAQ
ncbi:MAG: hypothetical protein IH624_10555 [Phycisphaerae bacterium]|nr:hypothetical protein [Phycisphaerae bacterium]